MKSPFDFPQDKLCGSTVFSDWTGKDRSGQGVWVNRIPEGIVGDYAQVCCMHLW